MSEDQKPGDESLSNAELTIIQKDKESKAQAKKIKRLEAEIKIYDELADEEKAEKLSGVDRTLKGTRKIHHDLFQLLEAPVRKDLGWDPKNPLIKEYGHVHFFHSVDSSGKPQFYCAPSAGHIHRVEHEIVDNKPAITKIGVPLRTISAKKKKDFVVDPKNRLEDRHIHKTVYLESEEIDVRSVNPKAHAAMATRASEDVAVQKAFNAANI